LAWQKRGENKLSLSPLPARMSDKSVDNLRTECELSLVENWKLHRRWRDRERARVEKRCIKFYLSVPELWCSQICRTDNNKMQLQHTTNNKNGWFGWRSQNRGKQKAVVHTPASNVLKKCRKFWFEFLLPNIKF
jgi:hypothetical protein